jgi:hypothetical protein
MILEKRKGRCGLYRIAYPAGLESDVRTRDIDGGEELTIAERLYRARRYAPAFEELPWLDQYQAKFGAFADAARDSTVEGPP